MTTRVLGTLLLREWIKVFRSIERRAWRSHPLHGEYDVELLRLAWVLWEARTALVEADDVISEALRQVFSGRQL